MVMTTVGGFSRRMTTGGALTVMAVLAGLIAATLTWPAPAAAATSAPILPLHTQGNRIVDASGG